MGTLTVEHLNLEFAFRMRRHGLCEWMLVLECNKLCYVVIEFKFVWVGVFVSFLFYTAFVYQEVVCIISFELDVSGYHAILMKGLGGQRAAGSLPSGQDKAHVDGALCSMRASRNCQHSLKEPVQGHLSARTVQTKAHLTGNY